MKKIVSILLSLLLVLSLAACMKVKAGESSGKSDAKSDTAAVTAQPTAEPTAAPTPEPTPLPFADAIKEANEALSKINSMHMIMEMSMDMTLGFSMGSLKQSISNDISMLFDMDVVNDPAVTRMNVAMTEADDEMHGVIYVTRDGDKVVTYSSLDDGATWQKNSDPQESSLPQSPEETFNMFRDVETDIQYVGTEDVNGKIALVYAGTVDGQFFKKILSSTGALSELSKATGADTLSEEAFANISDIPVTVLIEKESGLPVRYTIDMTDAMQDVMRLAMLASMGGELPEGMELSLEIPTTLEMTLSDFDAIAPIEIPEAALNAPEL